MPDERSLQEDIEHLRQLHFYPTEDLDTVLKNQDKLQDVYRAWEQALFLIARTYQVSTDQFDNIPYALENKTLNDVSALLSLQTGDKIILGIAGPGACGKETITNQLQFPHVVNTTTRPRRPYEQEGVHYYFITDEKFQVLMEKDAFITTTNRPGRGSYGIQTKHLTDVLQDSDQLVIEENPATLMQVREKAGQLLPPRTHFILTYILPPSPIVAHLAARLSVRCAQSGEAYAESVINTLGQRQVDEFMTMTQAAEKQIPVLFLVNDEIDRATTRLKTFLHL